MPVLASSVKNRVENAHERFFKVSERTQTKHGIQKESLFMDFGNIKKHGLKIVQKHLFEWLK